MDPTNRWLLTAIILVAEGVLLPYQGSDEIQSTLFKFHIFRYYHIRTDA